jgi:clan AA aspartic protease
MDDDVGRFFVELEVTNHRDAVRAESGTLDESAVRRVTVSGLVDTGATRLVLPAAAAEALGLPEVGSVGVRYADGRQTRRTAVGDAEVEIGGRSSVFTAVVEPNRTEALIGAIVLEELDFVVDCIAQKLVPRDPDRIIAELE